MSAVHNTMHAAALHVGAGQPTTPHSVRVADKDPQLRVILLISWPCSTPKAKQLHFLLAPPAAGLSHCQRLHAPTTRAMRLCAVRRALLTTCYYDWGTKTWY